MDKENTKETKAVKKEEQEVLTQENVNGIIQKNVSKVSDKLNKEEQEKLQNVLRKVVLEGMVPKDAMQLDDRVMNLCYSYAYNLFNTGKFEEANQTFRILQALDPRSPRYMMGLAACYHKQNEFEKAAEVYFATSLIDLTSPIPFYHMADCYMQMDDPYDAYIALTAATKRCGKDPIYAKLKAKCYAMMTGLRKTLGMDEENSKPSAFDKIKQSAAKNPKAA